MLSYAFQFIEQDGYEDIKKEEFDNIHNLFAAILVKGIGRQLKQGLHKEYASKKEALTSLRGKIDMPGTIQKQLERKKEISCEYDELSENNILNQIIKATVMLLMRQGSVKQEIKLAFRKEMLFFANVEEIDISAVKWQSIRFYRNNKNYRMLISICQLVSEGMLLTTERGMYKLASFVKPEQMERLYEKFILEYYKKEHPEINAASSQIKWAVDDEYRTYLPTMQSDIMLSTHDGTNVLIIDAKYYTKTMQTHFNKRSLHSNNMYQIFTYVKNKEYEFEDKEHKVSGMLLYAKTDEEIQPDESYSMAGNAISVKTLDLNKKFSDISEQLDNILEKHFDIIYQ